MRSASAEHAAHDETLVARFVAADLEPGERELATALVSSCRFCADLAADLAVLQAAVRELPAPRRTRDFRLTPRQAEAVRPQGWWARLVASIGSPGGAFAAPLAGALVTLGLVGLVLSSGALPGNLGTDGGQPALAPAPATMVPAEGYGAAESTRPGTNVARPEATGAGSKSASESPASGGETSGSGGGAAPPAAQGGGANDQASAAPTAPAPAAGRGSAASPGAPPAPVSGATAGPGMPVMAIASVALLVVGAALLLLRVVARRSA